MNFFIPLAEDSKQAEQVYQAIAKFNSASVSEKRIFSLTWRHGGKTMSCKVGEPLPPHYRTGKQLVLAILDCGNHYKICTENRGGLRGDAIFAGKNYDSHATYFRHEG